MAYQALYRKYRPHSFDDFIDQDTVKKILINSIENNKISHAYLFSGPRGIGKTSMAKIFAKAINCLNFNEKNDVCENCENCKEANDNSVDIIEIDAASNNGVDEIRDLKNKISIVPSKLKYKVYIIDEVHMLTNSAFNALLKTLEEPPSHVVFILATTEFYEVPETIVSRCQCYSFQRISMKSLEKRLKYIADNENILIDDDAITEIAHFSNGGLRDAIGMLDKIHSFTNEKITVDIFKRINGMISQEEIEKFYNDIIEKNLEGILEMIDKINDQGYDFKNFIEREMILVRDKIIDYYTKKAPIRGNINDNVEMIAVFNDILNRLKDAVNPMIIVKIYILKYIENISREIKMIDKDNNSDSLSMKNKKNDDKIISQEIKHLNKIETNISKKVTNDNNVEDGLILEKTVKNASKTVGMSEKVAKNVQIVVNEKNKKVRINNAMATANINYKNELTLIWSNLEKYFMDEKFGKVAQLLSDTVPMVVGKDYMILTTISDAFINNIYSNLNLVEEFIKKIYRNLFVVVVKNEEFEKIKNKYIEDKKNKIVYEIQKECGTLVSEESNLISQAINVFGSDLVDIE